MRYIKYHALGNDYIVLHPGTFSIDLSPDVVRIICHRNYGVGSDGILYGPLESKTCDFRLRIFNPDGSEAEKSGNGLRIFARSLYDEGLVSEQPFSVETLGGDVSCKVGKGGGIVTVQMGEVSFKSQDIPVSGPDREVLNEEISVSGKVFKFCAATIGNPHLSIAAIIEPGFFAVMEPVQSVQKTVWDASFKTADSPPFLHSFFLFLDRCIFVVVDRMVWPDNFLRREQLYKRHAGADQLTRPRGCGLEKLRAIPECPDWM